MNGTQVVGAVLLTSVAAMVACSEREPAPAPPGQEAAESAPTTPQPPAAPESDAEQAKQPQTPRETRRERSRTEGDATEPASSEAEEPDPTFIVPVDMQPPLTIKRSGADDIGVRALGRAKGVQYYLPQAWSPDQPTDPARLAQLRLPAPEGSDLEPGVLYWVDGDGVGVYDRLNSWLGRVSDPLFTPQVQLIDFGPRDPLQITQLIVYGTLKGGVPGGPAEDRPDMGFFAAVVDGAMGGTVLVEATGPREVMERQRKIWDYYIRTLRALVAEPKIPGR